MIDNSPWYQLKIDIPLFIMLIVMSVFGLVILYGASNSINLVTKQIIRFVIAFIVMLTVAQIAPHHLKRYTPYLMLIGVLLLVIVLLFGLTVNGAKRWLDLGLFRFQPSEILKIVMPIAIASILSTSTLPPKPQKIILSCLAITITVVLIAKQPDLGTSILIACSGVFVLFFSGISWKIMLSALSLLGASFPILWYFVLFDYQKQRILTFLNPELDPLGSGYHIVQSKITIGSGGIWGKGWLQGSQSQLNFLPEHSTDFIFAVLAEEFGLIGVLCLLLLYGLIIYRCLIISLSLRDNFARLIAASLTLTFFTYIIVNIGMVSGMLPVVGIPLPFVSYGGTSIVTLMAGFGIILSISKHKKYND